MDKILSNHDPDSHMLIDFFSAFCIQYMNAFECVLLKLRVCDTEQKNGYRKKKKITVLYAE